jgi:nucleoid-associated protein YgaU
VLTRCAAHVPRFARRLAASACSAALFIQPATAYATTDDEPVVRTPAAPAPQPIAVAEPAIAQPATPLPVAVPEGTLHLVVSGDNLWRIAAVELARRWGAPPDDHAIARYWRAVVDANRATLRSGDPNLIHPGELVVLPAD